MAQGLALRLNPAVCQRAHEFHNVKKADGKNPSAGCRAQNLARQKRLCNELQIT